MSDRHLATKAANIGQVFKLIVAGGIKPLDSVLPDAAPPVVELVHRMLARRRGLRPFDLTKVRCPHSGHRCARMPKRCPTPTRRFAARHPGRRTAAGPRRLATCGSSSTIRKGPEVVAAAPPCGRCCTSS
jgi:hypothetical protein